MKPIEENGAVSLYRNGSRITAIHGKHEVDLHYRITDRDGNQTNEKQYLGYAQSASPDSTGWIPYAGEIRDKNLVFLWRSTGLEKDSEVFWEVISFDPTTGEMNGQFFDNGNLETLKERKSRWLRLKPWYDIIYDYVNGDKSITYEQFNDATDKTNRRAEFTYGSPSQTENELIEKHYDDIISPYYDNNDKNKKDQESPSPIKAPSTFSKKYADKITNFDPSQKTLEIDTDSFGIDAIATFAAGKNNRAIKKLAKQDFDFLYDQKRGGLYFNENGAAKGLGDGGVIAILKGAPDLTSSNLEFMEHRQPKNSTRRMQIKSPNSTQLTILTSISIASVSINLPPLLLARTTGHSRSLPRKI